MKRLSVAAFLIVAAATSCARADTMIAGSVFNRDLSGNVCSSSGASPSALSMACGSPSDGQNGMASLIANLGDTSGTVDAKALSGETNAPPAVTYATVAYDLSVNGTYMLTGGTGYGWADLNLHAVKGSLGYFPQCTLTFGGQTQTQACEVGGQTFQFYVPYNTALDLNFDASFLSDASFQDGYDVSLNYNFSDLAPVPEPFSLSLLATGLVPLAGAVRRRIEQRG